MTKTSLYFFFGLIVFSSFICAKKKDVLSENSLSVAFYNIDNLYDDVDDKDHDDQDFTPSGKYAWTANRYQKKLDNIAEVISKMVDGEMPDVLGVCELESRKAFGDLLATGKLKGNYGIVHYDSPDERGIDVAFAYNQDKLRILNSEKVPVVLSKNLKDKTRDQLYVKALLKASKDTLHFYICHFPSRREGEAESEINRTDAAGTCRKFINSHLDLTKQHLIIMGDFNDEPWDKSIHQVMGAENIGKKDSANLLNLMWNFNAHQRGTYKYKGQMNTLDQMIISKALNNAVGLEYEMNTVEIFDREWLKQKGKYKGYPLRTFGGVKWLNGYSDHYAVYMKLKW